MPGCISHARHYAHVWLSLAESKYYCWDVLFLSALLFCEDFRGNKVRLEVMNFLSDTEWKLRGIVCIVRVVTSSPLQLLAWLCGG